MTVASQIPAKCIQGKHLAALVKLLFCVLLLQSTAYAAVAEGTPRRVFLLEGFTATQPAGLRTLGAFKSRLNEKGAKDVEAFIEFLELGRFPGETHRANMARHLSELFAEKPPDLVIPISRGALEFFMQYRDKLAPETPVVYCCTAASAATALSLPKDVVGVVDQYDWPRTLDLAERLQPNANTLAVISGASPYDHEWLEDLRRAIEPRLSRYNVRYLTGLAYDKLLGDVADLPPNTIVLMAPVFTDGTGQTHVPPEAAAEIASASSAPAYAPIDTFVGTGIVGGTWTAMKRTGSRWQISRFRFSTV